jgi:Fibronectin type III domain
MTLRLRAAILFTAMLVLVGTASVVHAQSATLAWDASTDTTVTGYRLSYGTRTRTYTQAVDVGKVTQFTVTGLDLSLDYFFAVQAYNSSGLVSTYSNEATLPAPVPPGTTTISSFTANRGFPLLAGTPVTWTTTASSLRGPVQYKFLMYSPQTGWIIAQDYTQNPSFTWTPGWSDLGSNHVVQVWVRSIGSPAPYEAWVATNAFDVVPSSVQLTADVDFPTPPGNPVRWTATVAGASSVQLEYKFLLFSQATGAWTVLRDYATSNQASWTPTTTGNYSLQLWARRVGSTAAYDVYAGSGSVSVARTTLQVTLSADKTLPAPTGTAITWTARPRGGNTGPLQYQFVRYSASSGWAIVKAYSTSTTYTWTPAWGEEGQYALQVWARNAGSTAAYDAWMDSGNFNIQRAPLSVTVGSAFPVPPGTPVTITGQVSDSSATFEYQFFVYSRGTGTWSLARGYSTANSFTWTPAAAGSYLVQVWARKVGSTASNDVYATTNYLDVAVGPAQITAVNVSTALPASAGTAITWTATGVGGTASPLQYKFLMYSESSGWTVLRDWSTQNTATWTPTTVDVGNHMIQVWVRSAGSTALYEGWISTGFFIIQP